MKLRKVLFTIITIFALAFVFGLAACEKQMSPEEAEAMEILNAIPVEDYHVVYDGLEHHIREAQFDYPKKGKVVYDKYDKYIQPGIYPYHVTFGLNGFEREVDVNLVIEKYKPVYTGKTSYRVYLDERNDFDVSFDIAGVELTQPINLTQVGDYKYTLETKETDIYLPIDPVEIQLYVRDTHYTFGFEDTTVIGDGTTAYTITLDESKNAFDSSKFTLTYTGNDDNVEFGKYYVTATIVEKSNNVLYDEYRAILTIDRADDPDFETYVQEAFEYFFGDNQLTINILIGDYAQYGLEHQECKWYTFEPYSDDDYQHDIKEVESLREEFNEFDPNKLSIKQLNDYEKIDEMIAEYEALFADKAYIDMRLSYVDQYGGYCADLPSEVEGFHIKNKEDLDDMVALLESVYPAFMSYYDYIEYREELGYPLNEYTLTKFIEYLQGVVDVFEGEEDYYLINAVNKTYMLNEDLGLTLDERKQYAANIKDIFNDSYYRAHKELIEKTQKYLDDAKAEGGYLANPNFDARYLGQYEKGSELYEIMLRDKIGRYDISMEDYIKQIDKWLKTYLNQWSNLSNKLSSKAENIADGKTKIVEDESFEGMLEYLKEFAKTIVPDLEANPSIDVIWMDPTTTENTTTVAYYMKSPLSESGFEYIHLNAKSLGSDKLDTIGTLAHEGYPGHLYAYVNVKENPNLSYLSTLSTNTTHGEGWATYVQIALNNYIAEQHKDDQYYEDWKAAMDYSNAYELMSYLLHTKLDYVVNYEHADIEGLKKAVKKVGLQLNSDDAYENLFNTFNESVATYPAYGYGKAMFWQLHLDAEKALGEYYDVVDFNQMLLSHGWCSIDRLLKYYDEYIADMKFKCGLK